MKRETLSILLCTFFLLVTNIMEAQLNNININSILNDSTTLIDLATNDIKKRKEVRDSTVIYIHTLKDFPHDSSLYQLHDTTLINFHLSDNKYSIDNFYITTGQVGHAHRSLLFNPNINPGFFYNYNAFDKHIQTKNNTIYYSNLKPYTSLLYTHSPGGDKDEAFFKAEHSQKLGQTIATGFSFDFLKAEGFYLRQQAKDANFSANIRFNTKDFRYGAMLAYYHSRISVMENGGIVADSLLASKMHRNRKTIDINIANATNLIKTGGWYISQYFNLFNKKTNSSLKYLKLKHNTDFFRIRNKYEDNEPDYTKIYTDNYTGNFNYIFDSLVIKSLENNFSVTNLDINNSNKIQFDIGTEVNYHNISYYTTIKDFSLPTTEGVTYNKTNLHKYNTIDIIPYAKLFINIANFKLKPEAYFTLSKTNNADYIFGGNITKNISNIELSSSYYSSATEAPWIYKNLYSTTLQWKNNFKKTFYNTCTFDIKYKYLEANIKYMNINNYSYLDQAITPQQSDSAINYLKVQFKAHLNFVHFELGGNLIYQYTDNKALIRVPDITGKLFFIYKQAIFRKALITHIGIDLIYNTPFYAESYMPTIRSFYLQDKVKTGNYPYLNAYIRFQVKTARFFLECRNIASGLTGYNYFGVPHYPMNDRQIRFGVNWFFND